MSLLPEELTASAPPPAAAVADAGVARVWSPLTVAIHAFLFGYPSGVLLAVKNWRALGMVDVARRHVLGAFAVTIPLVLVLLFLPSRFVRGVAVSLHIATFIYFKARMLADIEASKRAIERRPWYSALPWALLALLLFVVFVGLVGGMLAVVGVDVPD
jgi:hypothetical protein